MSGGGYRWILYFPSVPLRWPVKFGTNLTQVEVSSFESPGFVLEDGIAKVDGESKSGTELPSTKVISGMGTSPVDVPKSSFLSIPPSALKFSLGPSSDREGLFAFKVLEGGDGDKRPSIRNGKAFRFVPHPSTDHLKKMEEHRKLDCTILKYVKVPSPGYGAVLTVITPGSLDKKELYEVSIFRLALVRVLNLYALEDLGTRSISGCLANICTFFFKSTFLVLRRMSSSTALGGLPMR